MFLVTASLTTLLLLCFGMYLFAAYVFSRLGDKFHVGSFLRFLIPVYNIMLLCDCAGISRWITLGVVAPGFVTGVAKAVSTYSAAPTSLVANAVLFVAFAAQVCIWGSIAKRLGKNFWLWGILTPILMGVPVLIMAFDGSMPPRYSGNFHDDSGTRYIDV